VAVWGTVVEETCVAVSFFLIHPIAVKTVAADALCVCACRGRECKSGGKDCFLGCDMLHFAINFVLLFVEFWAKLDICWQLVKFLLL
jgi:hypothetical protein